MKELRLSKGQVMLWIAPLDHACSIVGLRDLPERDLNAFLCHVTGHLSLLMTRVRPHSTVLSLSIPRQHERSTAGRTSRPAITGTEIESLAARL